MNFLEGLKRLYIVLSIMVVVGSAGGGWAQARAPYGCIDLTKISPKEDLSRAGDLVLCPSASELLISQLVSAAMYATGAVIALLVWWFVFRWIITGFFPATGQKPPNKT